jgi:hypothetical protein
LAELYAMLIAQFESKHDHDLMTWEMIQGRLEAEWYLLAEKASSLSAAVVETEATKATLR